MFDTDDGIVPVSWLSSNDKKVNWVRLEIEDGILPVSALEVNVK